MKELLEKTNKSEWITTIIYRTSIYICWYIFAYIFSLFINGTISDFKLVVLIISLVITYCIRVFFKLQYKSCVNDTYYNLKHSIEMYYFKKLKNVSYEKCEQIDKKELGNRIIEVAYNYTKIISDLGEYIIPGAIGVFTVFLVLLNVNIIFGLVSLFALIGLLYFAYDNLQEDEIKVTNYNDSLKDFVLKILTVKKQNMFDYCVSKLDNNNRENDICILKNKDAINNIKFSSLMTIYLFAIVILTFIFIKNTVTRLGTILFLIIIIFKLQELLFEVAPAIKNMFLSSKNKAVLDEYFKEEEYNEYEKEWKTISINDGLVNYKDTTVDIKIPSFELQRKDHISILGKSGQGKSTILNVLSGIFKLDKGTISYDGNPSTNLVDAVYVSSNADIFDTSLKENICLSNEITDEELLSLIKEIDLESWINTLPKGLQTLIDNDIDPIVKLKINILRAVVMNKDVYFFDEPTLDFTIESEKKFANLLKKRLKDKTYIIVSKSSVVTNSCKKHYFIKDYTLLESEPLL